jgi:HAD superfamily hydrolase (TIGR01450 family)
MGLFGRGRAAAAFAPTPLAGIDVILADLDGVVYAGDRAIPHASEALGRASSEGIRVGYVTNNASRTPDTVAEQLRGFGLRLQPDDVVTSPQAAVQLLTGLVAPGSTILVVGGEGLIVEVEAAGFAVTASALDTPAAVVQGFHPSVGWVHLAEASYAIRDLGIPWIATNQDWTIPQTRGIAPGNGTLVSAVHTAVGILPTVAGKPERAIFDTAVARFGAAAPLMIGDRLDTDIAGANRAGMPSVAVLTGIDGPKQLLAAIPAERPTYILDHLGQLFDPYPAAMQDGARTIVGDAVLRLDGDRIVVEAPGGSHTELLRAGCALIWGSGRQIYGFEVPDALWDPSGR